jgi:hypothetical protein
MTYTRPQEALLKTRLGDPVHFINLLASPRQVGKTTIIRDIVSAQPTQGYYVSVDDDPSNSPYEMSSIAAAIRRCFSNFGCHWCDNRTGAVL